MNTHYVVSGADADRTLMPDLIALTEHDAYLQASRHVAAGATYVQVSIFERGQHIALTDWGKNIHGETWSVGPDIPQAPKTLTERSAAKVAAALATFALALALLPITTHAAPPTFETPLFPTTTYLAGCELRGAWDDGSRVLTCDEDGTILVFDPDGQMRPNSSGAPIRPPGWYAVE